MSIFNWNRKNNGTEESGKQEKSELQPERYDFQKALKGFRDLSMEDLEYVCGGSKSNKKDTPPKNRN